MMAFFYNYQVGDDGGTFTAISDYAKVVRLLTEGFTGRRGSQVQIPYRDGEYSEPRKFLMSRSLLLETQVRFADKDGVVTHINGEAGHVYENLAALKKLLGAGSTNLRMLRRNDPNAGAVETAIECLATVDATDRRHVFTWILRQLDGLWREQDVTVDTQAAIAVFPHAYTIVTGGNHPIGDAKFTFTCDANGNAPSIALNVAGDKISVAGAFVAGDMIVVDLARDRVITKNGARYGSVSPNRGWWMRLPHDTAALGMILDADSGTWTIKIEWRNKWL